MQNITTTLHNDHHRPQSRYKPQTSLHNPQTPTLHPNPSRQNSITHNKEKIKDQEFVNLYDRRTLKESKELMNKIEQMKNRLSYIDREGEKNKAMMKIKQQKLSYIKDSKEKASEWFEQLNEAKSKQKEEKEELKRRVSSTANQIVENVYKSKQRLLEAKAMNYKQMKLEQEMAKQKLIEEESKSLEEKKLKAKRVASSKKNSFLMNSTPLMAQSTQRSGSMQFFKSIKKPKKNKENENTIETMHKEFEQLVSLEQQKLEQLQSILKEKKEVEDNYNEVLHLKGSEI